MSRHLQTLFLLAVLSFLFVIPTQAQVTTASMSGTVMFQDEPVIGATVLAVHEPSRRSIQSYDLLRWLSICRLFRHYPAIGRELQLEC